MSELITRQFKHLLWKDESEELHDFLILKDCEVYRRSKDILRLVVFNPKAFFQKASLLKKEGAIFNEWWLDDGLVLLDVDKRSLPCIISLGAFKRRPNRNGTWIKDKERRLAHRILPYNPKLRDMEDTPSARVENSVDGQ